MEKLYLCLIKYLTLTFTPVGGVVSFMLQLLYLGKGEVPHPIGYDAGLASQKVCTQ